MDECVLGDQIHVEHALANGVGHMTAREERAAKFKNCGNEDGARYGESAGTNAGSHCVCNVVGTNAPCHVQREGTC